MKEKLELMFQYLKNGKFRNLRKAKDCRVVDNVQNIGGSNNGLYGNGSQGYNGNNANAGNGSLGGNNISSGNNGNGGNGALAEIMQIVEIMWEMERTIIAYLNKNKWKKKQKLNRFLIWGT